MQTVTNTRMGSLKVVEKDPNKPGTLRFIDEWPLLAFGKFDEAQLAKLLPDGTRYLIH